MSDKNKHSLAPQAQYPVRICMSRSCAASGASGVVDAFLGQLHLEELGRATPDGAFSVTTTKCLGVCSAGAAVVVGERLYERVKPSDVARIIGEQNG